ncbi:MAG TPA: primase-helicase family protein [Ohtaekwangia sp.]
MSQPQPNYEYLHARLKELGISDQQNTFLRTWSQETSELDPDGKTIITTNTHTRPYKIFDTDPEGLGNIIIHYFNLLGQPYRWKKEDTSQVRDFIRTRHRDPKEGPKYTQPPGSPVVPFFPPAIIRKYKSCKAPEIEFKGSETEKPVRETIPVLYLVEGEFKAFVGSLLNIDIVGLPGIHGFYNGDVKGKLHEDIEELIVTCEVEKIVMLYDADFLSVSWADGKDLSKRPYSFYGSIKSFRESLQPLIDSDKVNLKYVYYMHIKSKYMNDAKGLDDLLSKYADKSVEIQTDLAELSTARKFFEGKQINDLNRDVQGFLYRYLGLTDESEFYKVYSDFIGGREFKFKRRRYIYDGEKKACVFVKHEDAEKFMRIGPDWLKVITTVNKFNEPEEELVPWKISEIQRDYAKRFPDFIETIPRYDGFCNEPAWLNGYKPSQHNCYNVVRPLKWVPQPGSITNTVAYLKHVFSGQGKIILDDKGFFEKEEAYLGDQFTVALDYLTIMLKHPKHMLPVPCLVSPENNTGKSTFLKWLQMIFSDNMCILGNAQFQMKFNGHYATKFIISIDEGFLEVDKKAEKERLKQLVTADSMYMELKGMNVRKIPYYGKIIICSNDADRLMKIDEGESRWFVVRVPVITGTKDPDLEMKMKSEVQAWLHFLQNRSIFHPREDRLWFAAERFITEQFKIIVETTKNRVDRVFEDWIQEQFMLYRWPVLRYSQKYLTQIFNDSKNSKYKIDAIEMKAYLERKGLKIDIPQRHKIPIGFDLNMAGNDPSIVTTEEMGRPYKFIAEQWLSPGQLEEFKKPVTLVTLQEQRPVPVHAEQATLALTKNVGGDYLPF